MDLYTFFQSKDLKHLKEFKYISSLYECLKTDIKDWVSSVTGIEFHDVSATCSYYSDCNYLLVHDDRQEDRAVAFILYLADIEDWKVDWGGALQMIGCDEKGQPLEVAREVYPRGNQFLFFPVSNKSYHQVSVLS